MGECSKFDEPDYGIRMVENYYDPNYNDRYKSKSSYLAKSHGTN